jgi:DNA-binding PadR family transcriptional regulator
VATQVPDTPPVSFTQMVILGAVHRFQPVHGYMIRRELAVWHADQWASLNPGSVYNAIQRLQRDGLIAEVDSDPIKSRPARTTYRLTEVGDRAFLDRLREALSEFLPYSGHVLYGAVSFMDTLPRSEVIAALSRRAQQIEEANARNADEAAISLADPGVPDAVVEAVRLRHVRTDAELEWTYSLIVRLQRGEHCFVGELGHRANWRGTAEGRGGPDDMVHPGVVDGEH